MDEKESTAKTNPRSTCGFSLDKRENYTSREREMNETSKRGWLCFPWIVGFVMFARFAISFLDAY